MLSSVASFSLPLNRVCRFASEQVPISIGTGADLHPEWVSIWVGIRTLACSAHGAKNSASCSALSSALRRPPHRGRVALDRTDWRKRCWRRGTVARPTPRIAAVCSRVADAKAGSSTACAARSCSTSVARTTTCRAFATSALSIRRGLAITTTVT